MEYGILIAGKITLFSFGMEPFSMNYEIFVKKEPFLKIGTLLDMLLETFSIKRQPFFIRMIGTYFST